MEIFDLNISDIDIYRNDMCHMLKESFEISFPNKTYVIEDLFIRLENAKTYIQEGRTIINGIVEDNQLLGFIWYFIKKNNYKDIIHINHFFVREEYRGKGLGKILINSVELYAKVNNIEEIELIVSKDNKNSVNFYKNKNFEVERFVMKKRIK